MAEGERSRRGFLKAASVALGGAIGAVMAAPLLRYFFFPVGRKVVTSAARPVGAVDLGALAPGGPPVRVPITARGQRDAWGVRDEVTVGSAWVMREQGGQLRALSAVCPHLGCSVAFDEAGGEFRCPCHRSAFARDGARRHGPSKRGMDTLPVEEQDGRAVVTFIRYRTDVAEKIEV